MLLVVAGGGFDRSAGWLDMSEGRVWIGRWKRCFRDGQGGRARSRDRNYLTRVGGRLHCQTGVRVKTDNRTRL